MPSSEKVLNVKILCSILMFILCECFYHDILTVYLTHIPIFPHFLVPRGCSSDFVVSPFRVFITAAICSNRRRLLLLPLPFCFHSCHYQHFHLSRVRNFLFIHLQWYAYFVEYGFRCIWQIGKPDIENGRESLKEKMGYK